MAADVLESIELDDGALFTPRGLTGYAGQLFLRGDDGFIGPEPWVVNIVSDDIRQLKDIRPGPLGSGPRDFTEYDGQLFFAANDGANGYELWQTQGTKASTQLISDIWEGTESGVPTDLTVFGDHLYFFANDGATGRELYRSDGTALGTTLVGDLVSGADGVSGEVLTVVGDKMFFLSRSPDIDVLGLWVSDGTFEGTTRLDVDDPSRDRIEYMTPFGDQLLFATIGDLWISDGTQEGTTQISRSVRAISNIDVLDDQIFVSRDNSNLSQIIGPDVTMERTLTNAEGVETSDGGVFHWSSNGFYVLEPDGSSTQLVAFNSFFGTKMGTTFEVENGLLFTVNRALDRYEIWATNGSTEGTQLLETVTDSSAEPLLGFQQIDDAIYFVADNGNRRPTVWKMPAPMLQPNEPDVIAGDVTGNGIVDVQDVDALFAAVDRGESDLSWDINSDGQIDAVDHSHLLEAILLTKSGDFDLNGTVDFADFLLLSNSFGADVSSYANGDADGNGSVDFADFLLLSNNFGFERTA